MTQAPSAKTLAEFPEHDNFMWHQVSRANMNDEACELRVSARDDDTDSEMTGELPFNRAKMIPAVEDLTHMKISASKFAELKILFADCM